MTTDPDPPFLVTERFHVDRAGESVVVGDRVVHLNHRSYQVLLALMARPRALVAKRELFEQVWGTLDVSDAVLTTAVKEIRQALGDDARAPWAIATVHARGYRFLLEVQGREDPIDAPADGGEASPPADPDASTAGGTDPPAGRAPRHPPRTWLAAAAVLLTVVVAAVGWRSAATPDGAQPPPAQTSIAVLPFDDFSSEGGQDWFGNGLAEEILNSLAQSRDLLVAARTSSFRFGGGGQDIRDIARELAVTHVMEGSVRREADLLRVTAQLIRADDGFHVWSRTYDLPTDARNALALQRDIAEEVLATVRAGALKDPPAREAPRLDLAVYQRYLHGRELVMQRQPDSVRQGLAELDAVVRLAPDFAAGHAWLAFAQLMATQYTGRPLAESMTAAELHVRIALRLDPDGEHTLLAGAMLETMRRDVDAALALADRAVAASPNSVPALRRRGVILLSKGRHEEAHRDFLAVRARDPLSAISLAHLTDSHVIRNEVQSALDAAREGVRHNPDHFVAHGNLGRVLGEVGDYAGAVRHLERSVEINPAARLSTLALATTYWRVGLESRLPAAPDARFWTGQAAAAFAAGEPDRGLQLAEAHETGYTGSLVGMHFYHWYGDADLAYTPALRLAARDRLGETGLSGGYRRGAIPALLALERQRDPQAAAIRANLEALFADHRPGHFHFASDIYGAASWRMVLGEPDTALAWLQDAQRRGLVFRELRLDPLWAPVHGTPAFQAVVAAMEERAAAVRAAIQ